MHNAQQNKKPTRQLRWLGLLRGMEILYSPDWSKVVGFKKRVLRARKVSCPGDSFFVDP